MIKFTHFITVRKLCFYIKKVRFYCVADSDTHISALYIIFLAPDDIALIIFDELILFILSSAGGC